MKIIKYSYRQLFLIVVLLLICNLQINAQRMEHRSARIGGRGAVQHTPNRPVNNGTINGGAVKSPNRTVKTTPATNKNLSGSVDRTNNINNGNINKGNTNISGNTNVKRNTNISGNDVNINVNTGNNINVINQRNTVVRPNNLSYYHRPPYVWGGNRYYCFHPYFYHPYVPFYWGPAWHPWGFFIATLATTAIVVAVADAQYHYDQGVWYSQSNGGYTVVQAPVGGTVTTIPSGAQTVVVNNTTNYYYGGAFYEKDGTTYKVVPPPAGAVVDKLPEGGEEVKIGDQTYVKIGETYYQPVQVDGQNKYEISQVEKDK